MKGRVEDSRRNRLTDRKGIEGVGENKKWRKAKGRWGWGGGGGGRGGARSGPRERDSREGIGGQ